MAIFVAFLCTLVSGLSTSIGGLIALLAKKTNKVFLSVSLGFSAGVMIYVSMIEIFQEANTSLTTAFGEVKGSWVTVIAFFGGMLLIALIDRILPEESNPHEVKMVEGISGRNAEGAAGETADEAVEVTVSGKHKLMKTGVMTALAIAIHNFPEGIASFVSSMQEPGLAIPIIAAIAIHNIPEGIAVAVPIYQGTGSRKKGFWYAFLSGLAEPIGALAGWLLLMPIMGDAVFGIIFAGVAGIMVFISFDELLPSAREYGEHHLSIYGLISGMAVMAVSLLLFL